MPFEMLDIHAARQVNEVLKPYLHEYDLMKIAKSLHVPVDSLPDVVWHTTTSLGYEPTQESLAYGLGTVAHTVEVASRIQTFPHTDVSWMARIAPKDETGFQWEQGIMNLTLEHVKELDESSVYRFQITRLFETGFLITPEGNLVIKKVQKDALGYGSRGSIHEHMTPRDSLALNEKNRADRILDRLDELFKLNHSPDTQGWQTYGVLMSLAMLGPHSSGMVHFIEPYAHPEVIRQQEVLSSLRRAHRTRDEYREVRKSIKSTRNHVYKLVDFGRLCQEALYVPTAPSPFTDHIQASIDDIMQQSLALFDTHGDDTWTYLDKVQAFRAAQQTYYASLGS